MVVYTKQCRKVTKSFARYDVFWFVGGFLFGFFFFVFFPQCIATKCSHFLRIVFIMNSFCFLFSYNIILLNLCRAPHCPQTCLIQNFLFRSPTDKKCGSCHHLQVYVLCNGAMSVVIGRLHVPYMWVALRKALSP